MSCVTGPLPDRLQLDEAVSLAHTIVGEAAARAGLRALFIKGRTYGPHRLRPPHAQADVDVLVAPDDLDALLRQLSAWGWHTRLSEFDDAPVPHHSVTLIHPQWPCDLDVHHQFPGFLAEPAEVFEELWRRRQPMTVAGRMVMIPDFASSALLLALHSVRSSPDNPRHAAELRGLMELSSGWDEGRRGEIAELAARTGSAHALQQVLPLLGVEEHLEEQVDATALAQWQRRVTGREMALKAWADRFAAVPLRRRAIVVRKALWPSERFMRATRSIAEGGAALNRARLKRLGKALVMVWRDVAVHLGRQGRNVLDDALSSHRRWRGRY